MNGKEEENKLPDADNLEFRIKFEKFTALHLTSPGVFNKVFPDNAPANARKHIVDNSNSLILKFFQNK